MELKWIKLYADLFQHRKIDYISSFPGGDTIIVIWIRLLCLAGKLNNGGRLAMTDKLPYTEEMLASSFQKPIEVVCKALDMFENLDMISRENGFLQICNWEKYQAVEKEDKIREQTRKRVAEYKRKKKEKTLGNVTGNAEVTQGNAIEQEIEKEIEKEEEIKVDKDITNSILDDIPDIDVVFEKPKRKNPSLQEIEDFVKEHNSDVNPKEFFDYYNENGWKDASGEPIKSWEALLLKAWQGKKRTNGRKRKPDFVSEPIEDITSEARANLISQMFADGEEEKAWKGNQRSRTTSTR